MIVITGGAGFIGSALLWKLNQEGRQDIVLVDPEARFSHRDLISRARFFVTKEPWDFLSELEGGRWNGVIETIFHLGACSSTLERDEAFLFRNNTYYSQRLSQWALRQNVRFIYASSGATYGDGIQGFSDDPTCLSWLRPLNPYGWSKHHFDVWLRDRQELSQVVGLKFFNVYGPNENFKGPMASVVRKAFFQISHGGEVQLFRSHRPDFKDGEQMRDFVYVKDCVDALIWLSQHREVNGLFNLGTGLARTWNDVVRSVFKAMSRAPRVRYIDMPADIRPNYQYFTSASMDRLRARGLPDSRWSLESGVWDYVQGYLMRSDRTLSF